MVGLVLGVIRFPFILEAETSASITAGTNLSVITPGAISGATNHYRQNNIDLKIFLIMAMSGAIGAFIGSFLTDLVSVVVLLCIITIIVSYEAIDLMIKSGKVRRNVKKNGDSKLTAYSTNKSLDEGNNSNTTAMIIYKRPQDKKIGGIIVIIFSVLGVTGMGFSIIGSIIGIAGGIIALVEK